MSRPPTPSLCPRRAGAGRGGLAALLLALLAAPASAGLPAHPALTHAPPAPWVEGAELALAELAPAPEQSVALAYRLSEEQAWIDGARSAVYASELVEVISQRGLDPAAQWQVAFDPSSQRLVVHRLEVFRDGAWHDRLASARGSLLQREEELARRVYDETLTLLLVSEDVRVGDLVRFAYTVEGFNPIFGDRYAGGFRLAWNVPVGEHRLRLLSPHAKPFTYRVHGSDREPRRRRRGDLDELTWRTVGVPAAEVEEAAPPGWVAYPFVQVSQFASWGEVVEWALPLYRREPAPPALAKRAAEIAAAYRDPEDRLTAAVRWAQDEVRYFAVSLGPHSHAPHAVDEIVRRRYGDCKDKARLLITLLGELGIEAWPAFVDTDLGGGIEAWRPSPFAFDHAVVAAQLGDETLWIDATASLQGGTARSLYFPPYEAALEIRPGVDGLTTLPPGQSRPGLKVVRYDYRVVGVDEPLEVSIQTYYERAGADEQRSLLAEVSPAELLERYVAFYSDGDLRLEPLAPLGIEDDREHNLLSITERYRMLGCWNEAEDEQARLCDLLPLLMSSALTDPGSGQRGAPLDLPHDLETREIVALTAPAGWRLEKVTSSHSNPWFEFSARSQESHRRVEITYELATRAAVVPLDHIDQYSTALSEMRGDLGYTLISEGGAKKAGGGGDPMEPYYGLVGCSVLVLLPLGALAAVALIFYLVRRSSPARAVPAATEEAPHASPAAAGATAPARCVACGGSLPAGASFCLACGREARPSSRGGRCLVLGLGATVGGLGCVAIVGILAAIMIPNFVDALGKARQKRTLADLRQVSALLEAHRAEHGAYPEAGNLEELVALLAGEAEGEGGEAAGPATHDAWKNPLHYRCWSEREQSAGCDTYRLASAGSDGELEHADLADYPGELFDPARYERDLVLAPEGVVQGPR